MPARRWPRLSTSFQSLPFASWAFGPHPALLYPHLPAHRGSALLCLVHRPRHTSPLNKCGNQRQDVTMGPADAGKCEKPLEPRVKVEQPLGQGQGSIADWASEAHAAHAVPHCSPQELPSPGLKGNPLPTPEDKANGAESHHRTSGESQGTSHGPFLVWIPRKANGSWALSSPPSSLHVPVGPRGAGRERMSAHASCWSHICVTRPGAGRAAGRVLTITAPSCTLPAEPGLSPTSNQGPHDWHCPAP